MEEKKKRIAIILAPFLLCVTIVFASNPGSWMGERTIRLDNESDNANSDVDSGNKENKEEEKTTKKDRNPINGLECDNYKRRPFAVMLAGDLEAWPISSITDADLVIEMPVVTNGITRYMGIYVCNNPIEIGSIRSSRHDFISLAMGFDAIYAHWGGSHFALDKLNNKIMDNVNALYLDGSVFYRKEKLFAPHNGFTTIERLEDYSKRMGYRMESQFENYQFYDEENPSDKNGKLSIGYPSIYKVDYSYDAKTNSYFRFKGDKKDIDKLTAKQIEAKDVVIMFAASRQIEDQYNDVDVEGEGDAIIYQNGWEIKGTWKKDKGDLKSKIYFYNESGEEIKFVPGKIWIQVVQPNQKVSWSTQE